MLDRAHARSADRFTIAAHLGGSGKLDSAAADFGIGYADQIESDHVALAQTVASGQTDARPGL